MMRNATKDNIVVVVSGNFKKESVKKIIDKYFGNLRRKSRQIQRDRLCI